ncbi:MAG: TIGR01244 family phosphatase [Gammaproteobacteria bacterium]|nr:TIGR01244 family phosphatase [Chromatiales bacterium]MCC5870625.1 TIGR01244 family phosphatase [Gammaproteobacteria bacterium]
MALHITRLSPHFATTGQLLPEQMAEVAAAGFRALIDHRPDGEGGPEQPASASLCQAAEQAGLSFVYQPVVPSEIDSGDVRTLAEHLAALDGPVLAFCRTGARAEKLYRLAETQGLLKP